MNESLDDFRKQFIGRGGRGGAGAVLQSLHEGDMSASVILHQRSIVLLEEDDVVMLQNAPLHSVCAGVGCTVSGKLPHCTETA